MIMMAFDTETTGLVANRSTKLDLQPEVIEFTGIVFDVDTGETKEELDLLFRPTRLPLPPRITSITNITDEMLKDQPLFVDLCDMVFEFISRQPLIIAHNLSYDMEVLDLEADRLGKKIEWPSGLCTVEQTIHIKGFRLSLSDLHENLFGEKFSGAHRSKADVEALIRCCVELRKRGDL